MSITQPMCPICDTPGFHFHPDPPDMVNHPPHYTQGGIECIEAISAMTNNPKWTPTMGYLLGNVLKYLWRHADKDPVQSLEKARWYLDRAIAGLKGDI